MVYFSVGLKLPHTKSIPRNIKPAHAIFVRVASANREGSDEPVHPHRLARVFASRIHNVEDEGGGGFKSFRPLVSLETLTLRICTAKIRFMRISNAHTI